MIGSVMIAILLFKLYNDFMQFLYNDNPYLENPLSRLDNKEFLYQFILAIYVICSFNTIYVY